MTYRWLAHVGPTPDLDIGYRLKKDVEYWMKRCPIKAAKEKMIGLGYLDQKRYETMYREIRAEVDESVRFAKNSPVPESSTLTAGLFVS
jgi:TPP-dependent pyruvate/acetoin dehydrogenase alpha subunit